MDHLLARGPVGEQTHQPAIGQGLIHHHGGQLHDPEPVDRPLTQCLHVGGGKAGAVVLFDSGTIGAQPVSYTHLDVYKRQAMA